MIEEISGNFSRSIAKTLGETQGRSISRIISDKTGMSMGSVHFLMALGVGVIAVMKSRKEI